MKFVAEAVNVKRAQLFHMRSCTACVYSVNHKSLSWFYNQFIPQISWHQLSKK